MSVPAATLDEASKRFSRRGPWIVDHVSLSLNPGSKTTVVGNNGSGKSTLLRMIAGISRPTTGTVRTPYSVGYVPERSPSQVRMTGSDYLMHMCRIRGITTGDATKRSADLFNRLDLRPGPLTNFESLSKGNRQKVMVAQAFLAPVELLVLDEPFSGLDANGSSALQSLVAQALDTGTAVVMSLHPTDTDRIDGPVLRIERGRLESGGFGQRSAKSESGSMRVELEPSSAHRDTAWIAEESGARIVASADSSLVVEVPRGRLDQFLVIAIGNGWSVCSVTAASSGDDHAGNRL